MKSSFLALLLIVFGLRVVSAQTHFESLKTINNSSGSIINNSRTLKLKDKEYTNNWSINVVFSNNGFGLGAGLYKDYSSDMQGFASIFFSGAKDNREFEEVDIFGNTYTPGKINRLFMIPVNIGLQFRLFRESVTDELRPFFNFGIAPTAIIYTPFSDSFLGSFSDARARFTVGGFVGVGADYLTGKKTGVSLNVRYYYINLFGGGVESLQSKELNFFGGLYLVFGYNFLN